MKYEVVINNCYGGFNLSKRATKLLAKYKGRENENIDEYEFVYISRHDKDLLRVVHELGESAASGDCAELKIETLYNPIYRISEYDGMERVEQLDEDDWLDCRV